MFWMGHDLEAFLENSIESIATNARSVPLIDTHGLTKRKLREGGAFEDRGDHDDHKNDDHGHDDHGHDDHRHDETDPHVWLDLVNAKALVHEIEEALTETDPSNAAAYETTAETMISRLGDLVAEIDAVLEPVKGRG